MSATGFARAMRSTACVGAVVVSAGLLRTVEGLAASDDGAAAAPQGYVTGMIGSSVATLASGARGEVSGGALGGTPFNGDGAAGVSLASPGGRIRLEVEGRSRDGLDADERIQTHADGAEWMLRRTIDDEWSLMANAWRDVRVTDRLGLYLGGGVGAGGYRYGVEGSAETGGPANRFAASRRVSTVGWQAGGGVTYDLNERVTFDVGYRFHGLQPTAVQFRGEADSFAAAPFGHAAAGRGSSEVLLSVRVYDPLRGWIRKPGRPPVPAD